MSFALIQVDTDPHLWREMLDLFADAHAAGSWLYPQVAARPFGMMIGFQSHHGFSHRPTYRRLKSECGARSLPQRLADPAVNSAILAEDDPPADPLLLFDGLLALAQHSLGRLFALGDPPDYEPTPDRNVAAIARTRGEDPLSTLYYLMLERNATAMLMLPLFKSADGNHDTIREMLLHPAGVLGHSDGGAHC